MLNEDMSSRVEEEVADEEAADVRTVIDSFWIIYIVSL